MSVIKPSVASLHHPLRLQMCWRRASELLVAFVDGVPFLYLYFLLVVVVWVFIYLFIL